MQIRSEDIAIHAFTPSDGSDSAAIKVVHRPSGKEVVNDTTDSQQSNLRNAISELIAAMNPSPEQIRSPELILFDKVRVHLPNTIHDGEIIDLTWDYTRGEWRYFVESSEKKVSDRYPAADLELKKD